MGELVLLGIAGSRSWLLEPRVYAPLAGSAHFLPRMEISDPGVPAANHIVFIPVISGHLCMVAFATPLLALRNRQWGVLVVSIVLIYSAISMRRMVTPGGIVIVLLFAQQIVKSGFLKDLRDPGHRIATWTVVPLLVVSIGLTLYSNVERAQHYMKENRIFLSRYPVAMTDYMLKYQMSGRIFNTYGIGGYLIYRLAPQNQVYIDGRTGILYPIEHLRLHNELLKTKKPQVLKAELDKYSVDYIILQHNQSHHDLVQKMGDFGLDFLGARYSLYKRGSSNFPLSGKLLAEPACWHPDMLKELKEERQKMDVILPGYSGLFPFVDLILGYASAEDGKAYIDESIDAESWFDEMRRFAGYRFLETGYYNLVPALLGGVQIRKPNDYLASALAMINAGEYEMATHILSDLSNDNRLHVQPEDLLIQYRLYKLLEEQSESTLTDLEYVNALKEQLSEAGYYDLSSPRVLDERSFCSSSEMQ